MKTGKLPAIVGVGTSKFDQEKECDLIAHVFTAMKNAADDAGLSLKDIDGLFVNLIMPHYLGGQIDKLPELLGLDIRNCYQSWEHGRLVAEVVHLAGLLANDNGGSKYMAVVSGTIDIIRSAGLFPESWREGGGPHLEHPHYGLVGPLGGAAMALRRYFELYGDKSTGLGTVCVAQRKHALLNPNAVMQKPITLDDYLNSRFIVEPIRLLDCAVPANGACCIILTNSERARDCRALPIHILGGMGISSSREEYIFGRPGLGVFQQDVFHTTREDYDRVYSEAQVTQKDIDALYVYDSVSTLVLFALERWGFCGYGEAADWVQNGRIELGGELPLNTHGGNLSEAFIAGQAHIVEMVRQLRGECGPRQVKDAELAQYITPEGTSLILGRS